MTQQRRLPTERVRRNTTSSGAGHPPRRRRIHRRPLGAERGAPVPFVLPPLLRSVERVIVIDNGSIDGWEMARDHRRRHRDGIVPYAVPWTTPSNSLSPGDSHLATPPDSVHSRAYARNWPLSLVETPYVLEWAGDVVLHRGGGGGPWRIVLEIGVPRFDRGVPLLDAGGPSRTARGFSGRVWGT